MEKNDILKIRDLKIDFDSERGTAQVVRGVSITVHEKEILAIVGESGCGKSVTVHSILKLNPVPMARITQGEISLCGHDIVNADEREMGLVRGALAGMVFQEHMTGLNPTMRIGRQLTEVLLRRKLMSRRECADEAIRLLQSVRIPDAQMRSRQYPHEFSGGMRQRAMLAMALVQNPRLLIADEPTTALDVTIQAQILNLLGTIREEHGTSILLITHDLGVVANLADRVAVMYAGRIVEEGSVKDIFHRSAHPYTAALLRSIPRYLQQEKQTLQVISGSPPDLYALPSGCAFSPRCEYRMEICGCAEPPSLRICAEHCAACWRLSDKANAFKEGGV